MQNTTADYKLEINKPSRSFECKVTIGENIYKNEDIVTIILDYPQPQYGFSIGGTVSQTLDLTLINKGDTIYSTSQVKVEIGLKIGSTIEYILMGIFNIDDIEKTDYTTKFTCYDNMIKFETPYFSSLGDKPTLQQVVNELAAKTGVQFTGNIPAYTVSKLDGFTCREVLSYVASICGGNALITRDGKFTIKSLVEVEKSIDGNNYFEYKREEVKYKIGQISCQVDENNILSKGSIGTDSMELQFENPWVDATILTDIYNKLNGLSYLGYSMKWQGDLSLDPLDIMTVTDVKNVTRKIPILSRKLTYTGGLTSEIEAKGETKNKNSFSSSGSTTNKVNRLVTEQAVIKEALIEKANISDLKATNAEIANLKAKDAEIENAIIKKANIEDLTAINASIQNLIAVDANITNLIATKADITDLTATNIKFNVGTGGTLDLQTLLSKHITGENGQFLNITSSNTVIANAVIKDAMIENLSLNKVLAGTISTNKFNISSDDGGITIVGPTMQFKDKSNKVRLQLGQDTTGDFNFILRAADGTTTLIDGYGIKEKAIADKLIKSNMVADGAIGEQQINYSSLVTGLNKDTNTNLIKASKVAIDLTGQSLEVSFNSLKSNVDSKETRNLVLNSSVEKTGDNYCAYEFDKEKLKNLLGLYVTVSFDVKKADEGECFIDSYFRSATGIINPSSETFKINNEWSRYNYKVKITEAHILNTETIAIRSNKYVSGNDNISYKIYVKNIKVEIGENPKPVYSIAPEDIDSKIETNTTAISVAQGQISGLISESSITKGDVTTLKDNYTSLKATVDGINTTVASHTSSITTIQGTANSALASANNANSKIDGLEIGDKNLILNSDIPITTSSYPMKTYVLSEDLIAGEKYSIRLWGNLGTGKIFRFYMGGGYNFLGTITQISDGVFDLTFTAPFNISGNGKQNEINLYNYPRSVTASSSVSKVKLRKGDKCTNWTPAPEDVDSKISTISGKVTTVENKYTSLSQELSGFKTTVANTYSTKTELSNLNGTVSSINSRVSTAESSITQLNNKIALKVEATEVNTIVNSAINDVQVGGRNFITPSKVNAYTPYSTAVANEFNGWTVTKANYSNNLVALSQNGYAPEVGKTYTMSGYAELNGVPITESFFPTKKINTYMSVAGTFEVNDGYFKITQKWTTSSKWLFHTNFNVKTGDIIVFKNLKWEEGNKATSWTPNPKDVKESIATVDTKITTTNNKVASIETNLNSITSRVSSTESNISTINGNVSSLQSRMSSAESKITDSSIISTVQTTINTAKNEAINSANSSTDTKLKNYSTTSAMNSAITQKANEINLSISNTYLSKTDASNTYATKSSLTLTETNLVAKFSASGGYNLLKNSAFANKQIDNWWVWGGVNRWTTEDYYKDVGDMYIANPSSDNPGGLWQSGIPIKPNTKYTLSVACTMESNVKGASFVLEYQSSIDSSMITSQQIALNFDGNRNSYTFTTPNNSSIKYVKCGFRHEGSYSNSGAYLVYINKPCLVEGEVSVWSPNPFEIKDGSTMIDASGVTIYNGALTVKNNAGQIMLQGDGNGNLSFSGRLQPYDYQICLFGNDCKIDGSKGAIRMQWDSQTYVSVDDPYIRTFNKYSESGTNYGSMGVNSEGHLVIFGQRTMLKLLGNSSDTAIVQSRWASDTGYAAFAGSDFLNRSTIKDKTNVETIEELDFSKILLENNIFKYNLKTDVESVLNRFGLDEEYNSDEVVSSSADTKLGFILEELTEEAKALLNPYDEDAISVYSMCSILWKVCQEQQKRIELLESKII